MFLPKSEADFDFVVRRLGHRSMRFYWTSWWPSPLGTEVSADHLLSPEHLGVRDLLFLDCCQQTWVMRGGMQRVPSAGRSVRSERGSWCARGLVADHQGCSVGWGSPSSGVPPTSPTRLFPVLRPLPFPLGTHTSFSFCFSRVSSPMKKLKVQRTLRMSCLKQKVKPGLVVGATFGQC